jgi:hypothetical protein
MLNLKEQINDDLKQAMREKKDEVVSVLRMLLSAIKNKEITLRKGEDVNLNDKQIIEVLSSEIKKRKDSVLAYEQGSRQDLVDKEKNEIQILEKYLPEQLSDEELEKIVREIIETHDDVSVQDFGKIMSQVMPKVKGRADGNKVSKVVKKVLSE